MPPWGLGRWQKQSQGRTGAGFGGLKRATGYTDSDLGRGEGAGGLIPLVLTSIVPTGIGFDRLGDGNFLGGFD